MGNAPYLILSYQIYKKIDSHKLIYNTNLYGKSRQQNSRVYFLLQEGKRKTENSKDLSGSISKR